MDGERTEEPLPPLGVRSALPALAGWRWVADGGFSAVFAAEDAAHGRTVAVKVMAGVGSRWSSREAFAAGGLSSHPNVVTVYDSGITPDGVGWIVMEYLPHGSLLEQLSAGPVTPVRVTAIVHDLAEALDASHKRGIVHSDVKPGNAFVNDYGAAVLGDFGIARMVFADDQSTLDQDAGPFSRAYAAPEVLRGQPPTAGTDVWMLAATACHLLTGAAPFRGEQVTGAEPGIDRTIEALADDAAGSIDSPGGTALATWRLRTVLTRAFADDPGDRYPTCAAFAAALASVVTGGSEPPTGTAHGRRAPVAPSAGGERRRIPLVVAGVLVAVALIAGIVLFPKSGRQREAANHPASMGPMRIADLTRTWVPVEGGALQVDPVAGARRTAPTKGEWLGATWDGTQFWSYDDGAITRYDVADGHKIGSKRLPKIDDVAGAKVMGAASFADRSRVVFVGGDERFTRYLLSDDGEVLSTTDWSYDGVGVPQLGGWVETPAGGFIVVQAPAEEATGVAPEGSAQLVALPSDGASRAVPVDCAGSHSMWAAGDLVADACGEVATTYSASSLKRIGAVDLPELGDGPQAWRFANTDLQEVAGQIEAERTLLWSNKGFVEVDLKTHTVTARTPRASVWRASPYGSGPTIDEVWSVPASVPDIGGLVKSRVGKGGPFGEGDLTVAAVGKDLGDPLPDPARLSSSASDVALEHRGGRAVLVAWGERCCVPADVETVFIDPYRPAVVARSNPGTDVTLAPADDGAWMLDVANRSIVHISASTGRRRTLSVDLPRDTGGDGALAQRGSIEAVTPSELIVKYWDDEAWHLISVDLDDDSTTALVESTASLAVQKVPGTRVVWVFTESGDRFPSPVVPDVERPYRATLVRIDLASNERSKDIAVAEPGYGAFWSVLPDGGAVALDGLVLRHLRPDGSVASERDLSDVVVELQGEQVPLLDADALVVDPPGLAVYDGRLWMLRGAATGAPALVVFDLAALAPGGPARLLDALGDPVGDPVFWSLPGGLLIGSERGGMGVFDGRKVVVLADANWGFRTYDRGAMVGYGKAWRWVDGIVAEDEKSLAGECPTWIDSLVKSGSATLWLCPGNRTIGVIDEGDSKPKGLLDY